MQLKNMKKVLFLDRDGTIIIEPPSDFQVDSLEKLEFFPGAISNLARIASKLDYELVMVTNQDGLGTMSFPEDTFWPAHDKMIKILAGEGVKFSYIFIDPSLPEDNSPSRKPGIGMLTEYLKSDYDLKNSYVIGDRGSDVELAVNLGCKAIQLTEEDSKAEFKTTNWDEIYEYLAFGGRTSSISRKTNETEIEIELILDGSGRSEIDTGLKFFDHMLEQLGKHSGCDLTIKVKGDLEIDEHHTVEDTAIALGEAFSEALKEKRGINRYGFLLPMDDVLAQAAIDFSGRPWLVWEAEFTREKVGDLPTEMFMHFFKSFSDAAKCNLNIKAEGENEHHKIEAIFKAVAKSIKMAIAKDQDDDSIPSTKGSL